MSDFNVCIACLDAPYNIVFLKQTQLCETYEKLTNTTLIKDGNLDTICHICYAQLKKCYNFINMSRRATEKLTQLSQYGIQLTPDIIKPMKNNINNFTRTNLKITSFPSSQESVVANIEHSKDSSHESEDIKPDITKIKTEILPEPDPTNITLEIEYEPANNTYKKPEEISVKVESMSDEETPEENDDITDMPMIIEPTVDILEDKPDMSAPSSSRAQNNEEIKIFKQTGYSCDVCYLKFDRKAAFIRHTEVHTGNKPFPCTQCKKAYFTKGHLKRHLLIHTGERPYSCTDCDKTFTQSGHLAQHIKIHVGVKPYACDKCSRSFLRRAELVNHMQDHAEEYPSTCTHCNKKLTSLNKYKKHMIAHSMIQTDEENLPKYAVGI